MCDSPFSALVTAAAKRAIATVERAKNGGNLNKLKEFLIPSRQTNGSPPIGLTLRIDRLFGLQQI
jgi:hypothetical protein